MYANEITKQNISFGYIVCLRRLNMMGVIRKTTPSSDGVHTCTPFYSCSSVLLFLHLLFVATIKVGKIFANARVDDVILTQ